MQHLEEAAGACGRVQFEPGDALLDGQRNAQGTPGGARTFVCRSTASTESFVRAPRAIFRDRAGSATKSHRRRHVRRNHDFRHGLLYLVALAQRVVRVRQRQLPRKLRVLRLTHVQRGRYQRRHHPPAYAYKQLLNPHTFHSTARPSRPSLAARPACTPGYANSSATSCGVPNR